MKTPLKTGIRSTATLLLAGSLGVLSAHAAPLASDSFESYTAGSNIHGQTGGTGWSGAWAVQNISGGGSGSATVSATSITYTHDGVVLGGGNSLLFGANSNGTQRNVFSSVNTGGSDYYVSMIFQYSGTVFAGWQAKDTSVDIANDSIGLVNTNGSVGGRVDNGTGSSAPALVAAGTTYFMVIQYTGWTESNPQYTKVNLWINPAAGDQSGSSVSATFTDPTPADGGGSAGFLGLYVRTTIDAGETFLIDDLRVGTSWASVTAIPEPGAASLVAAGMAALFTLAGRRRRA